MNGYQELANAIILQAVKDYRQVLRILYMNPDDRKSQKEKTEIEQYFRSPLFAVSTKLDPELLMKQLQAEVH